MVQGGQTVDSNARRRFAAFISYAHADAAIAGKLQSRLERYRLPKHIAAAHADGQAALGQIFRDREDLAAAPSLSDAIRAAIAEAEALIVICSPDAQASRWVGEEIALFRSLHPDRPILAALVRGEPDEAFPDSLTEGGNEPLAADLRKEGDGEALGFLKIVAGIAGVPLDTLVQRDAQRRIRRVMWITGAALAAMLVMGVMTTLALQARNEAARQRAEAEGLVEYMLTDLREKLKGVGRLDVMEGVNERAMEHYTKQGDLTDLPADSLERRARTLHAMGEDDDKDGKLQNALAKFQEAHRTTDALLSKEPNNPDRIFAHAQSEYWVGAAAWRLLDRATTTRHYQAYEMLAWRLLKVDPNKARANLEMGYALGNLCELLQKDDFDLDKASDYCQRSINFKSKARDLAPRGIEIRTALANRYGWLADVRVKQKKLEAARNARLAEQQIVDALVADDPKNFELRFRQLAPQLGISIILSEMGKNREAADAFANLQLKCEALLREVPRNIDLRKACLRVQYSHTRALAKFDPATARSKLKETRLAVTNFIRETGLAESMNGYVVGLDKIELELTGGVRKNAKA